MICKVCDKEILPTSMAGHIRRGDVDKGSTARRKSDGKCHLCDNVFDTGMLLHGHLMSVHKLDFSNLKTDLTRKKHLVRERGHKCEVCLLTEWIGKPIPIQLDHVDGNSSNNTKENLRIICCNCHAQTDTYCGKNVGKNPDKVRAATLKKYGSYRK